MRDSFASAVRFIVESVESKELLQPPLLFFIRLLLSKLDYVQHRKDIARQTRHYFSLLTELLPRYFAALKSPEAVAVSEIFNPEELLQSVLSRLSVYQPSEKRGGFLEDCTLVGLLEVINVLI